LLPKLQAILSLGYRVEPVLLLLAQEDLDGEAEILLQGMASLNIAVRRVRHLEDAYRACAGLTLSSEEPHVSI
jgi:hypothetical protein